MPPSVLDGPAAAGCVVHHSGACHRAAAVCGVGAGGSVSMGGRVATSQGVVQLAPHTQSAHTTRHPGCLRHALAAASRPHGLDAAPCMALTPAPFKYSTSCQDEGGGVQFVERPSHTTPLVSQAVNVPRWEREGRGVSRASWWSRMAWTCWCVPAAAACLAELCGVH